VRLAIIALVTLTLTGFVFACGYQWGGDRARATQAAQEAIIAAAADQVERRTAKRIAAIRVVNQTIQGQVREVIRENPVYRDCVLEPAVARMLDGARQGRYEPGAEGGGLPALGDRPSP
jgi:hypothetical protein